MTKRLDEIEKNIASFEENITLASHRITENDRQAAVYNGQLADYDEERFALQKELESITDDIVTQLDSRLKDAGYSSAARAKSEENVVQILNRIKVLVSGRKDIFEDFSKISSPAEVTVKLPKTLSSCQARASPLSAVFKAPFSMIVQTCPVFTPFILPASMRAAVPFRCLITA